MPKRVALVLYGGEIGVPAHAIGDVQALDALNLLRGLGGRQCLAATSDQPKEQQTLML
jgi:hypothetical protein